MSVEFGEEKEVLLCGIQGSCPAWVGGGFGSEFAETRFLVVVKGAGLVCFILFSSLDILWGLEIYRNERWFRTESFGL